VKMEREAVKVALGRIWEAEEEGKLDLTLHPDYGKVESERGAMFEQVKEKLTLDEIRSIEGAIAAEARLQASMAYLLGFKESASFNSLF
jgi:hypothetical protein